MLLRDYVEVLLYTGINTAQSRWAYDGIILTGIQTKVFAICVCGWMANQVGDDLSQKTKH